MAYPIMLFPLPSLPTFSSFPPLIMLGVMPRTGTVPEPYCTLLNMPSYCVTLSFLSGALEELPLLDLSGLTVLASLGSETTEGRRSSAVWYSELREERLDLCDLDECLEERLWELCLLAEEPAEECLEERWLRCERREEEPALEMLSEGAMV